MGLDLCWWQPKVWAVNPQMSMLREGFKPLQDVAIWCVQQLDGMILGCRWRHLCLDCLNTCLMQRLQKELQAKKDGLEACHKTLYAALHCMQSYCMLGLAAKLVHADSCTD